MTEWHWLRCGNPIVMLDYLRGRANDRQRRLFACACCRRIWLILSDKEREGVETAERYADGQIDYAQFQRARIFGSGPVAYATMPAAYASAAAGNAARMRGGWQIEPERELVLHDELMIQANLLRDIIGNPFREVELDRRWLTLNDGAVFRVAKAIHETQQFQGMPVLADALEDAGCDSDLLLDHCRNEEHHVRGCWVIDQIVRTTEKTFVPER